MSETLLRVQGLKTWFGEGDNAVRAVDGVDLELRRGETFAVLGESGCGKSMTSLSIMRLVPRPAGRIVAGRIELDGQDLLGLPEAQMRRIRGGRIGMIFQEPMTSLNPVLSVGRQIGEALAAHAGLRGGAARARTVELLGAVGIPDPPRRMEEYPHQLSGGMKQRVMIAMTLAGEPDLLIADEPTTALDVTIQAQVLALMRQLQAERGMAILLITHDLGVVAEMADRVAVMYAGRLVEKADRARFFGGPAHPYSRRLFAAVPKAQKRTQALSVIPGSVPSLRTRFPGCRFADRCPAVFERCRQGEPKMFVPEPGQEVRCYLYAEPGRGPDRLPPEEAASAAGVPAADPGGEWLLRVDGLKVHYPIRRGLFKRVVGQVRAVDGVDMAIGTGHTLALVGESGCGKTTAGKGILQLIRPTGGEVRFADMDLTRLRGERLRRYRRAFQIIFQDPYSSMNPRMMIGDIIEEGMIAQGIGGARAERARRVLELMAHVGLSPDMRDRYPHEFSGGQRQRICIARALAVDPRLIVCDEPTSALDVSVQAQILNLLRRLQAELGLSYLFITHNIAVVSYLAHEVAVMYLGRIVEQGRVAEVLGSPRHPYTQALLSAVPSVDRGTGREIIRLEGDLPSPANPPSGCHFHPRCPQGMAVCREHYPGVSALSATHHARCHLLS
jgi:peptide/nickel transport system ATP-binding protein